MILMENQFNVLRVNEEKKALKPITYKKKMIFTCAWFCDTQQNKKSKKNQFLYTI